MKTYYSEPYRKEITTQIIEINEDLILVKDIITYEGKGGQRPDIGLVNNHHKFITVNKDEKSYIKIKNHNFKLGDTITVTLDWDNRYEGMRLHSAQHLISGLLYNKFNIGTVSVHIGPTFSIETDQSEISEDVLKQLDYEFNKVVREARNIKAWFPTEPELNSLNLRRSIKVKENIRLVEIEDYDTIACGGIHVLNTSEIGSAYYLKSEKVRGNIRLFFLAGTQLDETISIWKANSFALADITSARDNEQVEIIRKLYEEKKDLEYKVRSLEKEIIKSLLNNDQLILDASDNDIPLDAYFQVSKDYKEIFMCIIKKNDNRTDYLIVDKSNKIDALSLLAKLKARGSRKAPVFRGIVSKDVDLINIVKEML